MMIELILIPDFSCRHKKSFQPPRHSRLKTGIGTRNLHPLFLFMEGIIE